MKVDVYEDDLSGVVDVVDGGDGMTGLRFFAGGPSEKSSVTFWSRGDLRPMLRIAHSLLVFHYKKRGASPSAQDAPP